MSAPQTPDRSQISPLEQVLRSPTLMWVLRLILSCLLLWLVLHSTDLSLVWNSLLTIDINLMLLAIALYVPAQLFAAYRWFYLLGQLGRVVPYATVVRYNLHGQLASLVLPSQFSGDVVRALGISRGRVDVEVFALSVLIDKVALLAAYTIFAALGVLWSRPLSALTNVSIATLVWGLTCLLGLWVLCRCRSVRITTRLSEVETGLPAIVKTLTRKAQSILLLPPIEISTVMAVLALAFGLQLINTAGSLILAYAMHISIGLADWLAVNSLVSIAQLLPISIGGVGVREGMFAGLLGIFAVPVALSTSYSLTGFVITVVLAISSWIVMEAVWR